MHNLRGWIKSQCSQHILVPTRKLCLVACKISGSGTPSKIPLRNHTNNQMIYNIHFFLIEIERVKGNYNQHNSNSGLDLLVVENMCLVGKRVGSTPNGYMIGTKILKYLKHPKQKILALAMPQHTLVSPWPCLAKSPPHVHPLALIQPGSMLYIIATLLSRLPSAHAMHCLHAALHRSMHLLWPMRCSAWPSSAQRPCAWPCARSPALLGS